VAAAGTGVTGTGTGVAGRTGTRRAAAAAPAGAHAGRSPSHAVGRRIGTPAAAAAGLPAAGAAGTGAGAAAELLYACQALRAVLVLTCCCVLSILVINQRAMRLLLAKSTQVSQVDTQARKPPMCIPSQPGHTLKACASPAEAPATQGAVAACSACSAVTQPLDRGLLTALQFEWVWGGGFRGRVSLEAAQRAHPYTF
jgi:hypothetical protein